MDNIVDRLRTNFQRDGSKLPDMLSRLKLIATVSSMDLLIKKLGSADSPKNKAATKLQHKIKMFKVVSARKKETFVVDSLLTNMQHVTADVIQQLKNRIVNTEPQPVTVFCQYTRDYI